MKGFLGAFLAFSLWAVGSIYYLHLKEDTSIIDTSKLLKEVSTAVVSNPIVAVEIPHKSSEKIDSIDVSITIPETKEMLVVVEGRSKTAEGSIKTALPKVPSDAFENAQLLADEIKKTIAISDTIDLATNEPEQSLDNELYVAEGPSFSARIFYPLYNNTNLVLDKEIVAYASELKQVLIDHPEKKVTIIGYTDNIGNAQDNFKIALRKSRQVKWYLTARRGIPRAKVTATSRGEEEPIESNKSKWGRTKNNRIEIIID
ncbi:MAG: outer membrane protein OmpA-like peptidoglycan-associated protein [Flavobacteriales bacterium]|jgi:outer membrane protein OmpA-like peptidoglycan-associated protein